MEKFYNNGWFSQSGRIQISCDGNCSPGNGHLSSHSLVGAKISRIPGEVELQKMSQSPIEIGEKTSWIPEEVKLQISQRPIQIDEKMIRIPDEAKFR